MSHKILIVDDEKGIVEVLSMMIEGMGFVPLKAYSAMGALEIFHEAKPGIIITDLKLGGDMDGVALCSKILYEDKSTVVMAMSGYFSEYDKIYCQGVGFSEPLKKPIGIAQLTSAIQCAVERRERWAMIP